MPDLDTLLHRPNRFSQENDLMHRLNLQVAMALLVALLALPAKPAAAQTYTVLHTFAGGTDGQWPATGVIFDANGAMYGTTYGVLDGAIPANYGTIYKIGRKGAYSVIHRFHGPDGANPQVGYLIQDAQGNLYGTTRFGGTLSGGRPGAGGGTVFKLDTHHKLTNLYTFTGLVDGSVPLGTLVRDAAGDVFGATLGGGNYGYGTVFKIDQNGHESVLHSFRSGAGYGGTQPSFGVTADGKGNLFGVDFTGVNGAPNAGSHVFKIDKTGKFSSLYTFTGKSDGGHPSGQLILDESGNLYGITADGGDFNNGVVFKVDRHGKETVLHSFAGAVNNEGSHPVGGLIRDSAGNLYGATNTGGVASNNGTIFKLDTLGQMTILYTFPFSTQGGPVVGLAQDAAGNFYGATSLNVVGAPFYGAVFQLKP